MKFSNGIDLNGQRIQNVASASAATDSPARCSLPGCGRRTTPLLPLWRLT